jgi:small subunit ribosomal protein S20
VANIKSQIKRNRTNEKRRERNKAVKSELRTRVKKALISAEQGGEESTEATSIAMKRIDKAGNKGVIHRNAASRRKSRLAKAINRARAAATTS